MAANMNGYGGLRKILPAFLKNSLAIAAVAAALTLLPAAAPPAFAAEPAPSAADQNCLGCHGAAGMEKKLADGDTLQLHVPAGPYLQIRAWRQRLHQLSRRRRSSPSIRPRKTISPASAALHLP